MYMTCTLKIRYSRFDASEAAYILGVLVSRWKQSIQNVSVNQLT